VFTFTRKKHQLKKQVKRLKIERGTSWIHRSAPFDLVVWAAISGDNRSVGDTPMSTNNISIFCIEFYILRNC